jgi:eukaryotic-like serine/threonine-protein kinase
MVQTFPESDSESKRSSSRRRVEEICDRFAAALDARLDSRIEDYLAQAAATDRPALFRELLLLEFGHRRRRGEEPTADHYRSRFPEYGELVEQVFRKSGGAIQPWDEGTTRPQDASELTTTIALGQTAIASTASSAQAGGAGRFHLLRFHAQGGLGQVFVARDLELDREVALKQIRPDRAGDHTSRERFLLEATITGRLEHPGIVPVHGLGAYADGQPYYAMRFVQGETLRDAIAEYHGTKRLPGDAGQKRLLLRSLLKRFLDVCNAVAYAHSRGVLHRDLKPSNVMLGRFGETLLMDWGLAKMIARPDSPASSGKTALSAATAATAMGAIIGTPQYMSPEQAAGRIDAVGTPSDVYSLGTTLYTLLTGKLPASGTDAAEVLDRVRAGNFPAPRRLSREVPRPLEAICLKAMALRPENRYASAADLAEDIERWLADEPVKAWREPWYLRALRWIRRHKPLVAGIVAAAVTVAIALTVYTVHRAGRIDRTGRSAQERFSAAMAAFQSRNTDGAIKLLSEASGLAR